MNRKLIEKAQKMGLNAELIKKQKITDRELEELIDLYNEVDVIFDAERKIANKEDVVIDSDLLKKFDKRLEEIEYRMQELWHFGKNKNFHKFWFQQPLCSCPKIDNMERIGVGNFIVNLNCPIHGK